MDSNILSTPCSGHSSPSPRNAGIYATAAVVSDQRGETALVKAELDLFYSGFEACKPINFNKHGSDEVLVGRAGYLSGIYWLNERLPSKPFQPTQIQEICSSMLASGREYSQKNNSGLPLMYQYHGSEYLGLPMECVLSCWCCCSLRCWWRVTVWQWMRLSDPLTRISVGSRETSLSDDL